MDNDAYELWKTELSGTPDGQILSGMTPEEREDAFSGSLAFGTGGMRGVMGPGTSRMNPHTVGRATHGLAKAILSGEAPKSVGVAYDVRHNSAEFAKTVCGILSAYGVETHMFARPMPVPALSFAIRRLKLGWGVAITASHNPREYNGYKVYDGKGVQLTDKLAAKVTSAIEEESYFAPMPEGPRAPINTFATEVEEEYLSQIVAYAGKRQSSGSFPLVYTALHGTGANAIPAVLKAMEHSPICIQQNPDGDFGGIRTPNPEEPGVYAKAIEEAERIGASILFATDPDCDRIGVMEKTNNGYEMLSGNQIGALLIDYLARTKGASPGDTVITTIVSGMLGELVAKSYGLEFKRLLTGFKYIGEHAELLPKNKSFFFGYEESYGFLAGDGARDKDAVITAALIAQMAECHARNGLTLHGRLAGLSEEHGHCLEALHSREAPQAKQGEIMRRLRGGPPLEGLLKTEDYLQGLNELPPSDVIKLYFNDGSWAAVRPSGTEPKIKLYAGVHAKTYNEAKTSLESVVGKMLAVLGLDAGNHRKMAKSPSPAHCKPRTEN